MRIRVVFVCLGNICRSPLAEGVFRELVRREGLEERFEIDSAGTSNYHIGEQPDPRTVATARRRGLVLDHAARQFVAEDLETFDYVLAMDASNLGKVEKLARSRGGAGRAEVRLLREFDPEAGDDLEVPDPWFGGEEGFEAVQDMVERAAEGLLERIRREHGL